VLRYRERTFDQDRQFPLRGILPSNGVINEFILNQSLLLEGLTKERCIVAEETNEKISRQVEIIAVKILQGWVGDKGNVKDLGEGSGPDFEIHYLDSRYGIGEVGIHEDPIRAEARVAIEKKYPSQQIALPPGTRTWMVKFATTPCIKELGNDLPKLITSLREGGLTEITIYGDYPMGETANFARRLGIKCVSFQLNGTVDLAIFFLPSTGGFTPTDSNMIADWVEEVLLSSDFKDSWCKLDKVVSDEKHVFFMTAGLTPYGIDELLRSSALPTRAPTLPGELTHIWITARYGNNGAIYWSQDSGWQHCELSN
jgi:hypothetical protein